MGHVPSGPFSLQRKGLDLPRRQHRGSRPAGNPYLDIRRSLGSVGEELAAQFLRYHGVLIVDRNVNVGSGEIDILALDESRRVVVEVRTTTGSLYPLDAVSDPKREQVRRLAGILRVRRIDLIGVGIFSDHYVVHWEMNSV